MKAIPRWLNCDRYLALSPAQRLNVIQGWLGELVATQRGTSDELPNFVIKAIWASTNRIDGHAELAALREFAGVEVMMIARAQFDRAEAIKSCQHTWLKTAGVLTQACSKCGTVR